MQKMFKTLLFSIILLSFTATSNALSEESASFYTTWKLLNSEQKQQFIAGYLFGWKDAAKIAEIVTDYVKTEPDKAIQSLEKLENVYKKSHKLNPVMVSNEIDRFYSDSDNIEASLSQAVSSVRSNLGNR